MVFGDRFIYFEMYEFLLKTGGPSRQVVSHGSDLKTDFTVCLSDCYCEPIIGVTRSRAELGEVR